MQQQESRSLGPQTGQTSHEGSCSPLPRLPSSGSITNRTSESPNAVLSIRHLPGQNLQAKPTTALPLQDISKEGPQETGSHSSSPGAKLGNEDSPKFFAGLNRPTSGKGSEAADSISVKSVFHGKETPIEVGSIFGDIVPVSQSTLFLDRKEKQENSVDHRSFEFPDEELGMDFEAEFESLETFLADDENDQVLEKWRQKRKHFFILSSAGKPIYTRHGDDSLISPYIGIIQTIISFHQDSKNSLRGFSAGRTRIVVLTQGPLHLVAISHLLESDSQLRGQLEALYMQILSTLTLPALERMFTVRPSTDLRRPLQGTESLLSSLVDSFTRGSPSTLLSSLECLKLRKSHRQQINSIILKAKADPLLYGLLVAGGRLVSVIRPKKHSLHPGDLQLIFNMIFEADGVKAGGGESWIPICLPGFNSSGYLYMYVSFLDLHGTPQQDGNDVSKDDCVAVILISADKESFFLLREMRDSIVREMEKNNCRQIIKTAIDNGRPSTTSIVPGTVLRHFIYKSKSNVQFTMSSFTPDFSSLLARRRLMSTYQALHGTIHTKTTHVKVQHCISSYMDSLAWITPTFEMYCVAPSNSNRNALSQSANKVVQWVQQEEERVFIIGGAVF